MNLSSSMADFVPSHRLLQKAYFIPTEPDTEVGRTNVSAEGKYLFSWPGIWLVDLFPRLTLQQKNPF